MTQLEQQKTKKGLKCIIRSGLVERINWFEAEQLVNKGLAKYCAKSIFKGKQPIESVQSKKEESIIETEEPKKRGRKKKVE